MFDRLGTGAGGGPRALPDKAQESEPKNGSSSTGIHFEALEPRLLLSATGESAAIGAAVPTPQPLAPVAIDADHLGTASQNQALTTDLLRSTEPREDAWSAEPKPSANLTGNDQQLGQNTPTANSVNAVSTDFETDLSATSTLDPVDILANADAQPLDTINARQELVLVDGGIPNYEQLVTDLLSERDDGRDIEVVVLDPEREGVEQITDLLDDRQGLDAVHILSHGTDRAVKLGSTWLYNGDIEAHAEQISEWKHALAEDADLLFYGCKLAASENGLALVESLSELTGADIAASDDLTGSAALGGDWDLEYHAGDIETTIAADQVMLQWSGTLVTPVITERATVDSDSDGQIDQIRITTTEALNDNFLDLTVTVDGYTVTGYSTGIANDNIFYVDLTESGTPDTGATPTVTLTANTTLGDAGTNKIAVDDNWLDANWENRAKITFDNTAQTTDDLVDFPLLVTIDTSKLPSLDLSSTAGADVRFTDPVTGQELKYEVQSWDAGADTATIWVKVPQIDAGSGTDHIYVYYNYNGTATYDQSAADEAAVWPSGFGVYHLEEDPGPGGAGDIKDSDASPNNGRAQSGFATNDHVTGWIGKGIEWESNDDIIEFGTEDLGDNFRISAWVKPTAGGPLVTNSGSGDATDGFRLYISSGGQLTLSTGNGSAGEAATSSNGVINFGQWNHIAVDVDRTSGSAVIYHNGEDVTADGTIRTDFRTSSDWAIGAFEGSTGNNTLRGIIDEVRIGNATQGADWAKVEYLTQSGTSAFTSFASEEAVTAGVTATDGAAPVLLSASGLDGGTPGLLNDTGDQLKLVFSEAIQGVPSEADSEANFILSGTDGDNFPTEVGGDTIIALGTTNVANDTIGYRFSTGDTASTNLITPGSSTIDVNVGGVVANSIQDAAGNDLVDTLTGDPITITNDGANDAPTVDLDTDTGGVDYAFTFNEDDGPTAIVDATVSVTDVDDTGLVNVILDVGGVVDGAAEELIIGNLTFALDATDFTQDPVTIDGNAYTVDWVSATGVATITLNSGEMSLAQAETVLLNTRYQHTDTALPTAGDRTIDVTVNDGDVDSAVTTTTITVADANDAPVNNVPSAQSTPENTALVFSSGIGNAITVTDVDAAGGNIEVTLTATNGTVSITGAVGDPIQANDSTSGQQTGVAIDRAADGSMVVVWADVNSGGDIYAQRYDSAGNEVGLQFQVNTGAANEQLDPSVAVADDGSFVVVWQSKDQTGDPAEGIYARMFDSDGNETVAEFRVNTETDKEQTAPEIAMDANGNFVIVWVSKDQDTSAEGVYGQRFNSAGVAQGLEFRVNEETDSEQWQPDVAMDDSGNFVVTWASKDQNPDKSFGVFARVYNADGSDRVTEFAVHDPRDTEQQAPRVAMDADGDFVIVWESNNQPGDSNFGVYGQRYDSAGAAQGGEFRINTTTGGEQRAPDVAMTPTGGFTVVWESPDGNGSGVYAQEYDSAGDTVGIETRVNLSTTGPQVGPRIAMDSNGDYIVAWNGESPSDTDGIAAQRFLSAQDGLVFTTGDGSNDTTMTFSGTVADINNALDGLVFNPTADYIGSASLQIVTSDLGNTGAGGVQTDTDTIDISVFDAGTPDIDLDDDNNSGATDPNFTASFVEGGGPVAIADTDAVITDNGAPTPNLVSMTIRLTNQLNGADEVLAADTTGTNINASWNSALGRLTLSGATPQPLADFEQVLQTITYDNAAENPDTTDRIITFQATDGVGSSNLATTTVSIEAVNDAPAVSAPAAALDATEQVGLAIHGTGFSVNDADAGDGILEATFTVDHGIIQVVAGNSGVTIASGNNSDSVTVTGTRFQLDDLLTGSSTGTVTYEANVDDPPALTTFKVAVSDQGNTGTDPGLTGDGTYEEGSNSVNINITPVNDEPTLVTTGTDNSYTVGGGDVSVFTGTAIDTIEAGQTISGLTIKVSGVEPPTASNEILTVNGTEVILGSAHIGSQGAVGGFTDLTVSQSGNEFTLVFTGGTNTTTDVVSLIDGLTYRNDGSSSVNARIVEVTQVVDSGGIDDGGDDTNNLTGLTSTLMLPNAAPAVDLNGVGAGIDQDYAYIPGDGAIAVVDAGVDVADVDDTSLVQVTLGFGGAVDGADEEATIGDLTWALNATDFNDNTVTIGADTYSVDWVNATSIATVTLNSGEMSMTQAESILLSTRYEHTDTVTPTQGDRTINVRANDGELDSAIATTTITLDFNDAPVITDGPDTEGLSETDAALTTSGTLTVSDVDTSDSVTASVDSLVVSGTSNRLDPAAPTDLELEAMLTVSPMAILDDTETTATLTWDFDSGTETFDYLAAGETLILTYTIKADDTVASDTETVTITITGTNDGPQAVADSGTVSEDAVLSVAADGVLTNDTDLDGDTLSVSEVNGNAGDVGDQITLTSGALLTLNTNGSYTYDPNGKFENLDVGQTDTDSFSYTISDGQGGTNTATVTVTINGAEDAPVITADTTGTVAEDGTQTASGALTITDVDTNDNPISFADQGATAGSNGYGSFVLSGGTWTYTLDNAAVQNLDNGQSVTDAITYTASDGTSTQTITVTINGAEDAPVAVDDANTTAENTPVSSVLTLQSNDTDIDGDTLSVDAVSVGTFATTQGGTIVIAADGSYTYTPAAAFTGIDTFDYTVTDGTLTDTGTLSISVGATNDDPVATDDIGAVDEDATLTVAAINGVLQTNDTDPDGDTLTVGAIRTGTEAGSGTAGTLGSGLTGTYGTLTLNADGSYTYIADQAAADALASGVTATDTFTYTASDGKGGADSAEIVITVTGTNDAATVSAATEVLTETDVAVTASGTLTSTDPDNADDTFTAETINGTIGTLTIDAAGAWNFTAGSAYDNLNVGDSVNETFNVTSVDGTASTVAITINGTNDAATVSSATETLTETDAAVTGSGTLTSSDPDNADNTFNADTIVGAIGTFTIDAAGAWTFTANSAYDNLNVGDNVNETFNVTSVDGTASTVAITINGTNDAAMVSSATETLTETDTPVTASGTLTSSDPDNVDNTFTADTIVGTIGTFTIDAAGAWTFTANSTNDNLNVGDSVNETFTVSSIDGTTSTVVITINGTNDAATVSAATEGLVETDAPVTASGTLTSSDVDNPDNAFTAETINGTIGTLTIDAAGAWTFTANSANDNLNVGDSVNETFTVSSIDGTTSTVAITINGTNDGPVAANASAGTNADTVLNGNVPVATDVDGTIDPNGYALDTDVAEGTLTFNADGSYSFDPGSDFDNLATGVTRNATFTYTATDNDAGVSPPATVTITVTGTNDLLVATDPPPPPPIDDTDPDPITPPEPEPEPGPEEPPPTDEEETSPDAETLIDEESGDNVTEIPATAAGTVSTQQRLVSNSLREFVQRTIQSLSLALDTDIELGGVRTASPDTQPEWAVVPPRAASMALGTGLTELGIQTIRALDFLENSLDGLKQEAENEMAFNQMAASSAIAVTTGLSIGYVAWLLRSGVLLSSLLSSMPAWRFLDPLPVLAGKFEDDEETDDESLETIIEQPGPTSADDTPEYAVDAADEKES